MGEKMNRDSILSIVETIARLPKSEDEELVAELRRNGSTEVDAEFAVAFVPLAFGRATLRRIPACEGIKLPDEAEIPGEPGRQADRVHLSCIPHFSLALELAEEAFSTGVVGREKFMAVSLRSAEVQAVNRALGELRSLKGGVMTPTVLNRLGDLRKRMPNRVAGGN